MPELECFHFYKQNMTEGMHRAIPFNIHTPPMEEVRCRLTYPLRNVFGDPPQKVSSTGGVWILNGMAHNKKVHSFK